MKVLLAEDSRVQQRMLQRTLLDWGYEVVLAANGHEAWQQLQGPDAPPLAILDWMMPGLDGLEVCRMVRDKFRETPPYLILLTARGAMQNIVEGLQSGANDFIVKPPDREELKARVAVGRRVVELQQRLAQRVRELESALDQVNQLHDLLPMCSYCKKIRDDKNYWEQVDRYLLKHSEVRFSH
jgi:DNA-binding response OmpR family regulator